MDATKALYTVIKKRHIPISAICRETGLPAKVIYTSLSQNGKRKLRADELIQICGYLKLNPLELINQNL